MTGMTAAPARWLLCGALICLALTVGVVALGWLPVAKPDSELVLVARDMTFFRDGQFDTPNPPLQFTAGTRVRLVLRNEDPGMTHNFAIPAWSVATRDLDHGDKAQIEFVVPGGPSHPAYECTPHARLMHGPIEIR